MGGAISHLIPCLNPEHHHHHHHHNNHHNKETNLHTQPHHHNHNHNHSSSSNDVVFTAEQPLDETLGHSFCYVRSSARFLSPTTSDRFISTSPTSTSLRFEHDLGRSRPEPVFRSISGASVSANTATPRTFLDDDDTTAAASVVLNGFDCSSSFAALPLQPVPRGEGYFLSGPIERGALSGPIDPSNYVSDTGSRIPFSAPLSVGHGAGAGGTTTSRGYKKRRKKSLAGIKRSLYRSFSEKKRPWVVPVGRKEGGEGGGGGAEEGVIMRESEIEGSNVQWALGKAGEDRVHVVVSEEHGWLFVGIYDGFNGPDAPEFLMGHLYRAVFLELKGLFWDNEDDMDAQIDANVSDNVVNDNGNVDGNDNSIVEEQGESVRNVGVEGSGGIEIVSEGEENRGGGGKRVTFLQEEKKDVTRRKLWEFLAEDDTDDGLDLSGSERFAFSVDDAVSVSNAGSAVSRRSLLLSKLKHGWGRSKDGHSKGGGFFQWKFGVEAKDKVDVENRVEQEGEEEGRVSRSGRRRKTGPVDHRLVLRALEHALEKTENAYLDLTERVIDRYPELALMGSCLLVVLMRDEDVYVMNLGDSRAIVAQCEPEESCSAVGSKAKAESGSSTEGITEDCTQSSEKSSGPGHECLSQAMKLTALQLSTDHSTSIEEEVLRIKREHPDDNHCIVNDRVKGRLKVTRAFGAGFLKQAKFNDSLLEMFRNEFIGAAPYVSCIPSLRHHRLSPRDQFVVLSSDGLYQYLSNQEVVSFVENFMERYPDGDPAQHLIEELLQRAAKKAGMDFHDLLDIPQGDRRKYHDDVTVMVISLEGRIWKSSGKYP